MFLLLFILTLIGLLLVTLSSHPHGLDLILTIQAHLLFKIDEATNKHLSLGLIVRLHFLHGNLAKLIKIT